jgi:uncharacterized protein YceK
MKTKLAIVLAVLISGCASVPESTLEQKTARTLGLQQNQFQISNVQHSGIETSYTVKAGKKTYSCYVTAVYSAVGRTVSDAVCSSTSGGKTKTECNDLLKAAGKF